MPSLGDAILAFEKKMRSDNPGNFHPALLEFANLTLYVTRLTLPDDENNERKNAIVAKLQQLIETAFPEAYADDVDR